MNQPQIRLAINGRPGAPVFNVCTTEGGKGFGTLQELSADEVRTLAQRLGQHGGRDMLDAFEIALINAGHVCVWPVDETGDPLSHEHEALEVWRGDGVARILWQRREICATCDGAGHRAPNGVPVEEHHICVACEGGQTIATQEILTDMDGLLLPATQ